MSQCKVCDILKAQYEGNQLTKDEYFNELIKHNNEVLEQLQSYERQRIQENSRQQTARSARSH